MISPTTSLALFICALLFLAFDLFTAEYALRTQRQLDNLMS